MSDEVKAVAEKLKGKKGKIKKLDGAIEGTKVTKLPKDVIQGLSELFPKAKFQQVRVHVGGNAPDLCKQLGSKAFVSGNDIVFKKAGDSKDSKLLAHELTHVLQQHQGKMPKEQKEKVAVSK
ncbi:MAG: DUF4157 domain-containing protein [Aliishimia sp.]